MTFALRLALIAFIGASTFSSNAYAYYFPMLAAMCVAVQRAGAEQLAALAMVGPELPVTRPQAPGVAAFRPGTLSTGKNTAWRRPPIR